jgi:glycerol uptake facilitator-like aquaporin
LLVEALLTFFLVNTILHTAVAGKGGSMAGLAIGMTLTAAIFVGAPLTGASLNPARTFGPALYIGTPALSDLNTYLIYFVGPFLGAALAALVFNFFNGNKAEEAAAPAKAAPRSTSGKSKK